MGRDAICVNFSNEPDRYPYVKDGGALAARSWDELAQALDLSLAAERPESIDEERRRFLKRHAGASAEGRGAEALIERILALEKAPRENTNRP